MPKQLNSNLNPFLPVETVPLVLPSGETSSRRAVIFDPTGENLPVGYVSSDYKLVPNSAVAETAHEVLQKTGFNYEDHQVIFDGKKFRERFILDEFSGEVKVGDTVKVVVDAINSYDGSTKFGLEFNALRLICENGLMVSHLLGGFRFKHWGDRNFDEELQNAARQIGNVGNKLLYLMPQLTDMSRKRVKRADIQKSFKDTDLPLSMQAKVFNSIAEDNQWGLFNAYTDVFSRMGNFHGDNLNRKVSRYFLSPN